MFRKNSKLSEITAFTCFIWLLKLNAEEGEGYIFIMNKLNGSVLWELLVETSSWDLVYKSLIAVGKVNNVAIKQMRIWLKTQ